MSDIKSYRFVFIDLFVNCVYTRHQFRNFPFLELLLNRTWGQTFTPVFMTYLPYFFREKCSNKVFWLFDKFLKVMNLKSFEFDISGIILRMRKTFHPRFSLHVTFMEKEPSTKFYGVFLLFFKNLWSYKALND